MKAIIYNGDIEALRPVARSWYDDTHRNSFNVDIDIDAHLADLHKLIKSDGSDLLVLIDGISIVGYMGIETFTSPLSTQKIANEHYWYVLPEKRGIGSMRFIQLAQQWAKEKTCSHLIMNASNLASRAHNKVCQLYERLGMKKFETSYIAEI